MNIKKLILLTSALVLFSTQVLGGTKVKDAKYKNPKLPIDTRVDDLLARMTLEEKVKQLQGIWVKRTKIETDDGVFIADAAAEALEQGIGQVGRPSENKGQHSPNKTPQQTVDFVNAVQKYLVENTRLGIPAIMHEEALHGHSARNGTSFPQAIALASSWDPSLLKEIYSVAASEVRRRGGHQALTPILDVARDPRWGRIEETLGEDPYLVAALGVEGVKGFQGDEIGKIGDDKVIATLKHLTGHGEPSGGLNIAPTPVGERTLREVFLFPFEAAIKLAGARSVMASYNEIDGVPSHANDWLLQDVLRDEWKFEGVVVSDYFAILELITRHSLVQEKEDAAIIALNAGVDIELPDGDVFPLLVDLVKRKKIEEELVDRSVRRILKEKFIMGLFEQPYVKEKNVEAFVGRDQHRKLALKAAEESVVLLRNEGSLLPLNKKKLKSIALIGPHVHETLLGGYSDVPKQTVSILQGMKDYLGKDVALNYAKGTILTIDTHEPGADSIAANSFSKERWTTHELKAATDEDRKGLLEEAVAAAKKSDVAIVVVGGNEHTAREGFADHHLGDRTSIDLFGNQEALVNAILATGKPVVLWLLNGRPLSITNLADKVPAIVEGWYLGQETGTAVARILFGDVNPSGKMPLSVARSVGHIPVYYNHKVSAKRGYAYDEVSPLYAFGHGLSYTSFEYSDLDFSKDAVKAGKSLKISMTLKNTGKRSGAEVVQLYINDPVASVTRPVKELKGFQKIALAPGQKARVSFELAVNQLGFYDKKMDYSVEPGEIKVMVGSSSQDIRLEGKFMIKGKKQKVEKAFLTPVQIKFSK